MAETTSLTKCLTEILRRVEIVAGNELGARDKTLVAETLVMRLALLYDLTAGSPNHDKVVMSWRRTILGIKTLDVGPYSQDWKTLREIVTSPTIRENYPDCRACKQAFKQLAQTRIHYQWILSISLMLIEGDDWFWRVNQWIVFDSKLNLATLDLTQDCCQEYLDFERTFADREGWLGPDGKGTELLTIAKRAARDLVGDFRVTDYPFRPSHGNGGTAEVQRSRADAWHKNRYFKVDSEVITYLRYRVPESDWRSWFYVPYKGLNRVAEVACVPKGMSSNRTISREPTTLQYLQQDLLRAMDDYFAIALPGIIDLHDQTRSRILAQAGSSDGSYATIDLSAASDSVSVRLINELFDGLPILYPLMATRSTHVHVRSRGGKINTVIELKKFAPMGSGTCFPTECIVFAIMAETAVRVVKGSRSRVGDYVIYGDDIVIKARYAAELARILEHFGFQVNLTKSFFGDDPQSLNDSEHELSYFREACGIECFNGIDITPLRLSRRLVSLTDNDSRRLAGQGVGIIDLVNRAYLYGYSVLRRWLCSLLEEYFWFRGCQYLAISDYRQFCRDIASGKQSGIWVTAPFIITDDACDTNWRCRGSRYVSVKGIQESEACVIAASSRNIALPLERGPRRDQWVKVPSGRRELRRDSNDYFTWAISTVARTNAEIKYELDATGIATLRTQDLEWSEKWIVPPRPVRLRRGR